MALLTKFIQSGKNIFIFFNFMYKFKNKHIANIFNDIIKKPVHQYSLQFSKDSIV